MVDNSKCNVAPPFVESDLVEAGDGKSPDESMDVKALTNQDAAKQEAGQLQETGPDMKKKESCTTNKDEKSLSLSSLSSDAKNAIKSCCEELLGYLETIPSKNMLPLMLVVLCVLVAHLNNSRSMLENSLQALEISHDTNNKYLKELQATMLSFRKEALEADTMRRLGFALANVSLVLSRDFKYANAVKKNNGEYWVYRRDATDMQKLLKTILLRILH